MTNSYNKPHTTVEEQIDRLRELGLQIAEPEVAAGKIEEIGYQRLKVYFHSRRNHGLPGKPFHPGTTLQNILELYECDAELSFICFEGVRRFELAFRNRISEALSAKFGSHPYCGDAFDDAQNRDEVLRQLLRAFNQSKDRRAIDYRRTYKEPPLPPIWLLKELLTFGASARFYGALKNPIRKDIAEHFGVLSDSVFDSWARCFVDLRNLCAHHDRLFNRRFQKQPQKLRSSPIPVAKPATLKAQLECLDYVLVSANAGVDLVNRVEQVLNRYPEVQRAKAGF